MDAPTNERHGMSRPYGSSHTPVVAELRVHPRDKLERGDRVAALGTQPRGRVPKRPMVVNPDSVGVVDDRKRVVGKGLGVERDVREGTVVLRVPMAKRPDLSEPARKRAL